MRMRGFTLLELLVTVLVVAILASIAAPAYQQVRTSNQLAADVNSLLMGLNYARVEAVKRRANVEFRVVAGGTGWAYEVLPESGSDPLLEREASGSRVWLNAGQGFTVVFNSLGRTASTGSCANGCLIELSVTNGCRAIRINQLGNIRREECAEES